MPLTHDIGVRIPYPLQKTESSQTTALFFVCLGDSHGQWRRGRLVCASRNLGTASSVGEVDIGQYTNKFAIAYIYLASLSDLPKFLVAWSAQACCDRSNPSKGRKEAFFILISSFVKAPAASGGEMRAERSQFFIHYKTNRTPLFFLFILKQLGRSAPNQKP